MSELRPPEGALISPRARAALDELELPLIVLVGGATGTGKSTVATEVAHRLGLTRVTSTDVIRQTMRAFFSREFMPSIHYSSFELGSVFPTDEREEAGDPTVLGFLEQTRNVLVGVRAVLQRAIEEGYAIALEGVHLVPGMIPALDGAVVCHCILAIEDEEVHAGHFWTRETVSEGLRPFEKYLQALPEIRRIQRFMVERARRVGVPVVENSNVDDAVEEVVRLVVDAVERARA